MLVHTAIPKKWSDFEDFEPNFTLVGSQSARKRKLKDNSFHDTSLHTKYSRTTSSTTQNTRRASNRFSPSTSSEQVEANENDLTEEDFHAREQTKQEAIISLSPQKKFNYIVVKQRSPEAQKNVKVEIKTPPPAKTVILNTFKSPKGLSEDESEVINEEVYFTETLVDADERIHEHAAIPEEKEVTMEGYSEFIFSGEKFVQMPKRVFEAEKEKIKREAEKYKNMLKKLKGQLNKMTDLWTFNENKFKLTFHLFFSISKSLRKPKK